MVVKEHKSEIEALRELGVKRADFDEHGILRSVEFFDAAPLGAEGVEKAEAGEPEVPGGFVHAASILLSKQQGAKQ
jgi:hypothetical protein